MYGPTTITTKGQVTIPGELRLLLNTHPGDKLLFNSTTNKKQFVVEIVSTRNSIKELAGSLHRPGMKYVPINVARKKVGMFLAKELGIAIKK